MRWDQLNFFLFHLRGGLGDFRGILKRTDLFEPADDDLDRADLNVDAERLLPCRLPLPLLLERDRPLPFPLPLRPLEELLEPLPLPLLELLPLPLERPLPWLPVELVLARERCEEPLELREDLRAAE